MRITLLMEMNRECQLSFKTASLLNFLRVFCKDPCKENKSEEKFIINKKFF